MRRLTIILFILLFVAGCNGISKKGSIANKSKTPNAKLEKDAADRDDKLYYGEGTASLYFPVYFPLILPEGFKYSSHKLETSDFEGNLGTLSVTYKKGDNHITFYQGSPDYDGSRIEDKQDLALGNDKNYAFFQKRASGNIYIGWLGNDSDMANENYIYVFEMSGVSKSDAILIAKKTVPYK